MKRKRQNAEIEQVSVLDTRKPTATFRPAQGRSYTVSVALPGSIIANAQTHELKTALAGQIARALSVFCVDEIVIFDDGHVPPTRSGESGKKEHSERDKETGYTAFSNPSNFLYHVLSYVEAPPHLRRALFPHHPNLRTAGSLPSLDMPHHSKPSDTECLYREGVTLETSETAQQVNGNRKHKRNHDVGDTPNHNTYANIGAAAPVRIRNLPDKLPPNVRITLKLPPHYIRDMDSGTDVEADAVAPEEPREEQGYYWGYSIRVVDSLSSVFEESPYEDGYDYSIGTSERGTPLQDFFQHIRAETRDSHLEHEAGEQNGSSTPVFTAPKWSHLLIVFGGVAGLEQALRHDSKLQENGVKEVREVFDAWINLVPNQGSRTIRTEEALWIGLMGLNEFIHVNASKP